MSHHYVTAAKHQHLPVGSVVRTKQNLLAEKVKASEPQCWRTGGTSGQPVVSLAELGPLVVLYDPGFEASSYWHCTYHEDKTDRLTFCDIVDMGMPVCPACGGDMAFDGAATPHSVNLD